ncbi:hypothetical protein OG806_09210 [Streptomyces sp. NBC_00882]|uniref:hypothetical protein n=1 Tax=Streptomyces TaxID=1883 RepID=UPI0038633B6C|nr:hypothetical protein OG806_09210 [Streptomyces sp. NBC_00882]WSZ64299.1 hypothetical protein OH824_07445 [Streptomyces canus]
MALPAVDGKQYVYRVYAPEDALLADLFWEAWHCHDERAFPRVGPVRRGGDTAGGLNTPPCFLTVHQY